MRAILALSLTLAAVCVQAQKVTLDAMQNGKNVGTLTFERKQVGANLRVAYTINVTQNGQVAKFDVQNLYDMKGYPKTKQLTASSGAQGIKLMATFTGMKAKVTATTQGKNQSRELPAPSQTSLNDASVWWFINGKPKAGASVKYQTLNLMSGVWSVSTTKYVGPGTVKVKGKSVKGHQIVTDQGQGNNSTIWLDDQGLPLSLEQGGIKFVRK